MEVRSALPIGAELHFDIRLAVGSNVQSKGGANRDCYQMLLHASFSILVLDACRMASVTETDADCVCVCGRRARCCSTPSRVAVRAFLKLLPSSMPVIARTCDCTHNQSLPSVC